MKRNRKNFDEWTKWDWFMDDARRLLSDPLTWLLGFVILLGIGLVVFVVVVIIAACNGQISMSETSSNGTFWTWFNLNTTLRNILH